MLSISEGHKLTVLLNMMNENKKISRSHGLTPSLLNQQAKALGVSMLKIPASWEEYETKYREALNNLKTNYKAEAVVFGDIDLEPHREWEEKVCDAVNLKAMLPLWQQHRKKLVFDMIDSGIKTIIVSCNTHLGEEFLGKEITKELAEEIEALGVDACGENGEYHTLVIDCPLFLEQIKLPIYTKTTHKNYCFIVWEH
jgi:diphthine-ammonia ligase